jgi:hypothetical protein
VNIAFVKDKWEAKKPSLKGLILGLLIGPVIALWAGWAVPTYAVQGRVNAALLKLKTSICVARARVEVKDTTKLEWGARAKLAQKWGTMPGEKAGSSGFEITNACAEELAEIPKSPSS